MRYAAKVDANHRALIERLRAAGWLVLDVHGLRKFVDAIALKGGRCVFIEFKAGPTQKARKQRQGELHQEMRRAGAEVAVVATVDDLAQFERQPFPFTGN